MVSSYTDYYQLNWKAVKEDPSGLAIEPRLVLIVIGVLVSLLVTWVLTSWLGDGGTIVFLLISVFIVVVGTVLGFFVQSSSKFSKKKVYTYSIDQTGLALDSSKIAIADIDTQKTIEGSTTLVETRSGSNLIFTVNLKSGKSVKLLISDKKTAARLVSALKHYSLA